MKTKENPKKNSQEIVRNEKGQLAKGVVLNPNGRPKGGLSFTTKWRMFVDRVAKENNLTPKEIDEQLLAVGFKRAKEGDYSFWRDIHDRLYGRAGSEEEAPEKEKNVYNFILNPVFREKTKPLEEELKNQFRTIKPNE